MKNLSPKDKYKASLELLRTYRHHMMDCHRLYMEARRYVSGWNRKIHQAVKVGDEHLRDCYRRLLAHTFARLNKLRRTLRKWVKMVSDLLASIKSQRQAGVQENTATSRATRPSDPAEGYRKAGIL